MSIGNPDEAAQRLEEYFNSLNKEPKPETVLIGDYKYVINRKAEVKKGDWFMTLTHPAYFHKCSMECINDIKSGEASYDLREIAKIICSTNPDLFLQHDWIPAAERGDLKCMKCGIHNITF